MWYTKQLLVCPYFYFGLARMLSSSNPPLALQWLDLFADIGFLPIAGMPVEPLTIFKTFVVVMGISSVVAVN
jgi:hypothetical protein